MSSNYTTTGGLVFLATALTLLLQTDVSSSWSVPRNFAVRRHHRSSVPSSSHRHRHLGTATVALFSQRPLATEGDWAAYSDNRYNRIYYFNHVTGESVWSKPTDTFPDYYDSDDASSLSGEEGRATTQNTGISDDDLSNDDSNYSDNNRTPNLYEILQVPTTASRSQIKASYLGLAKRFHPDAVAKAGGDAAEGRRVFNDISRAWMVLSDDGLRRGYDESLQADGSDDAGDTMMEEDGGGGQAEDDSIQDDPQIIDKDGIRDATILRENKFEKNPVYKKKMDMADGRANKFARGQQQYNNNGPITDRSPTHPAIASASPLEIDYEAEEEAAYYFSQRSGPPPLTASQATLMAQDAWREAIAAEKASLQREAASTSEELRAAEYQARRWNVELENTRREQQQEMRRRQEERRKNSERGVKDGRGGTGGVTMEERLRMRKLQKSREAERVGRELTSLGGGSSGTGALGNPGGGSSGVLGGPSERPDAFFGGQMSRSMAKSSSNIREEQRLNSLLKKGAAAGQGQPQKRGGPMVAERPAVTSPNAGVASRDVDREMLELKNKYEGEIDRLKKEMTQIANNSQSNQLKDMVNNHKKELERVKQEMETASEERLENELRMLEEKHAGEMQMMELQVQSGGAAGDNDSLVRDIEKEHSLEVASLKEQLAMSANFDQSERLQQLEESHKRAIEQVKIEMEATSAKELQSKLQEMEAAHKWQLQSLQSGHQAELMKSKKEASDKLRWEVERSISSLKREHEREIKKLRTEATMNVSESVAMETMQLNHEAEMELLRAELFGEAARDIEEAIASLNSEHQAEIAQVKATMERQAEEQLQMMQQNTQAAMTADLQEKASAVEKEQQQDMEQVKRQILEDANLTESEQIQILEESHKKEIEDLKKAADSRLEEEILKIAQIHAREITKLRDDLEASAANTIRNIQTDSARQRQVEVEKAISQLQMQQEQERERIRQELMQEIEQNVGTKVFSQKAELERVKSDMDLQSKQVMATEMRKLKQNHIGEMEKLKRDTEKFYAEKMEQLRKDMVQKKRSEIESLTNDMKQRHAMELDRVRSEMSSPDAQRQYGLVAEQHQREMEKLRSDLTTQADLNLQQKINELTRSHQQELEDLKRSMKATAVADTLQFQTQANIQRTIEVDKATLQLKQAHQKELELLRRSMMVNANASEKERMEIMEASHRDEIERTKAQMESSFAKMLENELQLLEQSHQKRLNEIRDEMSAQKQEFAKKEALMQSGQDKQVEQFRSEMKAMKESHASEMSTLKSNLLKDSDASYEKQIDSFNAELERVKAAATANGKTQIAIPGKAPQNIEELLHSLQTVYPSETINKLREELNARNAGLSQLDKVINSNLQQMNVLETKFNASEQSQQTLTKTILSLETWKKQAEEDIRTKAAQLQTATAEMDRLKREVGMRSSDAVASLQQEIRTKTNELANLNSKTRSLKKETSELRSRLDAINKEKADMLNEINQLKEWKRKAEANHKKEKQELESQLSRLQQELIGTKNVHKQKLDEMDDRLRVDTQDKRSVIERFTRDLAGKDSRIKELEGSLDSKEAEIGKLKHGLRERNDDVSTLVPEVARLQALNAEMKAVNDDRIKEFSALKIEAERLKLEFEKGNKNNLATAQQLKDKLEREQSKHTEFIKKLEETAKAKADEINSLQSNLVDKTKKISDLEQRLGSMSKMSSDLSSLEEYRATTEKSLSESKQTIRALQNDLDREKAEDAKKTARIKELERQQESMFGKDGEIQRLKKDLADSGEAITRLKTELDISQTANKKMANDISEFKSVRYSSEASLKKTSDELALAQREVERMKREIENLRSSGSTKTQSVKDLERKLTEKESQLKTVLESKESEMARLNTSVTAFASERDRLLGEVEKLSLWKSTAEETINAQCEKIDAINFQLQVLERELKGSPSSEYETLLKERASLIEKLAQVKNDFVKKNDKIKTTKIQTANLLRRNSSYSSTPPPGTTVRTVRRPILTNNVVIGEFVTGEFSHRRRNVAPVASQALTPTEPAIVATPPSAGHAKKTVVSPPNAPTLQKISKTMSAYDIALEKARQAASIKAPAAPVQNDQVTAIPNLNSQAPMSGWAGYKDSKWGGYLDNLSSKETTNQSSGDEGYQYEDNAWKGFGYLDNLSAKNPTENPARKDGFLEAEKKYLMNAKNLALDAAKSFEEAQSRPGDKNALEQAIAKKREVDELLSKAKEMRAKAEEITI